MKSGPSQLTDLRVLAPAGLALAALWCLTGGWVRDVWFDEAMTLLLYVPREFAAVLGDYSQPNNHIGYTLLLKLWSRLNLWDWPADLFGRAGTMLTALAALGILYFRHWRRTGGRLAWALVLGVFAVSLPFQLYGTALRGYMAGFLATVLALEAGGAVLRSNRPTAWTAYAACSLAAVLILPSNLLALAAVLLWLAPQAGKRWWKRKRLYVMALIPLAALAAVYLPLLDQVAAAATRREGWHSALRAGAALYLGFSAALLPALLLAGRGWCRMPGKIRLAALLLPLLPLALLPAAPFPRTFFPLWPVWLLLAGSALRAGLAGKSPKTRRLLLATLAAAGIVWGWGQRQLAPYLSSLAGGPRFSAAAGQDDWFRPYYLDGRYAIRPTAEFLGDSPAYVSFDADFFALAFYRPEALNIPWYTADGRLPRGAFIVLAADEDRETELTRLQQRFRLPRRPRPVHETGFHVLYRSD